MSTTREFFLERIQKTKDTIVLYEDAADQLATGKIQSFTLDTGQSRETVTKLDSEKLQATIDSLYNRLDTLDAWLTGCVTSQGGPEW